MGLALGGEGGGEKAHLSEHGDEPVGARRGEVLREPDLLDEVQLAIDDILGALVIQHAQQEADDPLDDEGVALPVVVDALAILAGGDPHTALAALDEVGRRLVRLGERC